MSESAASTPPVSMKKKTLWAWTVATFFGCGLGHPGPGTYGSVAAVLLWGFFAFFAHPTAQVLLLALGVGIVLSIALGVPAATIAARESSATIPAFVVIDEVAGQWITLALQPCRLEAWSARTHPLPAF